MKRIKLISLSLLTGSCLYGIFACSRDIPQVAPLDHAVSSYATVQVFAAAVKSARNYVYVDGAPVSGAAVGFQGVFPGTAYSFKVNAGARVFLIKDTLSSTTQTPLTFTQTLDAGKNYTIFTYDTITSVKEVTVQNKITIPTDTTCMLRFGNFLYSPTPLTNVDVYSFRRGNASPVFTNVATAQVTDFIPYASGLTDTLYVYAAGTTSPLIGKSFVTSLTPSRSYTAAFNGTAKGTKAITTFITY